jgi:hypothetical protein
MVLIPGRRLGASRGIQVIHQTVLFATPLRGCEKFTGRSEGVPGRIRQGARGPKLGSAVTLHDPIAGPLRRSRARPGASAVGRGIFHNLSVGVWDFVVPPATPLARVLVGTLDA